MEERIPSELFVKIPLNKVRFADYYEQYKFDSVAKVSTEKAVTLLEKSIEMASAVEIALLFNCGA